MRSIENTRKRVAVRFEQRTAAFVPAKWFKSKAAELRTLLKQDLPSKHWADTIDKQLMPWVAAFVTELDKLVPFHAASPAYETVRDVNDKLRSRAYAVRNLDFLRDDSTYDPKGVPEQQTRWTASWACINKIEEANKTVGDLFKYSYEVDKKVIEKLVQKPTADVKKAALKAIKKTKLDWNPLEWIGKIYEDLTKVWAHDPYRTFDINGMKVVVKEASVTEAEIEAYVGYLKEAHHLLKAKGIESAWYGTFFIDCESCGGVNSNTGGGTGGVYHIGPDTVTCFSRPSSFVVALIVHELGHRYWFKQMRSEQRARFTALVKARTVQRPSGALYAKLYDRNDTKAAKDSISAYQLMLGHKVEQFTDVASSTSTTRSVETLVSFISMAMDVYGVADEVKSQREAQAKQEQFSVARKKLRDMIWNLDDSVDVDAPWIAQAKDHVQLLGVSARAYVDILAKLHNDAVLLQLKQHPATKEWLESYDKNPAPVDAVSNYGKSNIDEAFAEVFSHYVLGFDMTRDQMESFRSVLSKGGAHRRGSIARRVLARFHRGSA